MKSANAVLAMAMAIALGTFGSGSLQGQEAPAAPNVVRIAGNETGVPWVDLVKALRPKLDLSNIQLATPGWIVPWQAFQSAASDTSAGYHQAVKIISDASGKPTAIDIDVAELSIHATQWKQEFAEQRVSEGGKPAFRFESVPNSSADNKTAKRRVLVIAGYQSQPGESLTVAQYLHDRSSLPCEIYVYPSDGGMDKSAQKLAELLAARYQESPQTEWTIVAHSMGSVIARAAIEVHEAKGVKHLIQIFPPNHGSVLAEIAEPLDGLIIAKSQLMRIFASFDGGTNDTAGKAVAPAAVLTWMSQGFGLASRDLRPDSDFLKNLNTRQRKASVDYSMLIGTGGPLRPLVGTAILLAGPALEEQLSGQKDMAEIRKAWNWVERIVRDGQLTQGQGDGVVATHSARLPGVSDVTMIHCSHVAWSFVKTENGQKVMDEVLKRIK
jgi:pimeloyl-ACP methyl ester carboxylesterase